MTRAFSLVQVGAALLAASLPSVPAQAADIAWRDPVEVASGDAHQGPWRMNRSEFRYVDDPSVACDESGTIGLVWVDQTERDIYFQRYSLRGEALAAPVRVSHTPEVFSWLPRVLLAPGRVYILWQEIVFSGGTHGGDIFFARSRDGGASFDPPLNLSRSLAGDGKGRLTGRYWHNGSLDLARGPEGILYAAWTEYEGALWIARSVDGGESFSTPLRIAGGAGELPARGPSLAVHGDTVYVAWTVGEDEAADIHLARSDDRAGAFSEARAVAPSAGHSEAPKIAVDDAGTLHLVFGESPSGLFERYHIRYLRSSDGGRSFAGLRDLSNPAPDRFASGNFPALAIDGEGRLYVLWDLFPDHRARPRGLAFSHSEDGGESFAEPAILPGSVDPALGENGSRQGLLTRKLAVAEGGAAAVVNSTFRRDVASYVWLTIGRRDGE